MNECQCSWRINLPFCCSEVLIKYVSNLTLWYFYLFISDLLIWIFHYFQKTTARIGVSQTTLASAPVLRAVCRFSLLITVLWVISLQHCSSSFFGLCVLLFLKLAIKNSEAHFLASFFTNEVSFLAELEDKAHPLLFKDPNYHMLKKVMKFLNLQSIKADQKGWALIKFLLSLEQWYFFLTEKALCPARALLQGDRLSPGH